MDQITINETEITLTENNLLNAVNIINAGALIVFTDCNRNLTHCWGSKDSKDVVEVCLETTGLV